MDTLQENPQRQYWDDRFRKEGKIWGDAPCGAALQAGRIFKNHRVSRILVPGCGYGRNSLFFAKDGFQVVGFDISSVAIEMAREEARKEKVPIHYFVDNILDSPLEGEVFEGIFSFNTLHLFLEKDRERITTWLARSLAPEGILVFTSMSTKDGNFGQGEKIAPNTFESKKGRPVFYFSEETIKGLFGRQFKIEEVREIEEQENHGGKAHSHGMWFLSGHKK